MIKRMILCLRMLLVLCVMAVRPFVALLMMAAMLLLLQTYLAIQNGLLRLPLVVVAHIVVAGVLIVMPVLIMRVVMIERLRGQARGSRPQVQGPSAYAVACWRSIGKAAGATMTIVQCLHGVSGTCCAAAAFLVRRKPGCTTPGTPVTATVARPSSAATITAGPTLQTLTTPVRLESGLISDMQVAKRCAGHRRASATDAE